MAGGLFGKPFVLNIKCIVFSLICMMLFLYKPSFKYTGSLYATLFLIFVLAYVAMAWYDYYYDCRVDPLKRGEVSLTGLFKPPPHQPDKQIADKDSPLDKNRRMLMVNILHVLLIVPILLYIVYARSRANPLIYPLLVALAMFTLIYHGIAMLYFVH